MNLDKFLSTIKMIGAQECNTHGYKRCIGYTYKDYLLLLGNAAGKQTNGRVETILIIVDDSKTDTIERNRFTMNHEGMKNALTYLTSLK